MLEHLISPIQHFLREDMKDMRETRKNFDRVMEKYDIAVHKYFALSKTKEQSALKEVITMGNKKIYRNSPFSDKIFM